MSELRLFSIAGGKAQECHAASYKLEREVQNLFETNLEELLGVRFVASEFSTGQGGRIDTLGIDENGFPVVIEYKLDKNRTVINQGMSYMAWLRSHKAEFWKVVFEKLGKEAADAIATRWASSSRFASCNRRFRERMRDLEGCFCE